MFSGGDHVESAGPAFGEQESTKARDAQLSDQVLVLMGSESSNWDISAKQFECGCSVIPMVCGPVDVRQEVTGGPQKSPVLPRDSSPAWCCWRVSSGDAKRAALGMFSADPPPPSCCLSFVLAGNGARGWNTDDGSSALVLLSSHRSSLHLHSSPAPLPRMFSLFTRSTSCLLN